MPITVPAVGVQAAYTTATGAVTLPATPAVGDLILLLFAGRPSGTAGTNDAVTVTGYTAWPATIHRFEIGANDLAMRAFYKYATASETNPTVTVGTVYTGTSAGWSGQILYLRGVISTNPADATPVTSNAAAATTFTPTGITTATADALVVSFVASADDNALSATTLQSFTSRMAGATYDTVTGGDHAVGVATRSVATPGAVTCPTWTQTAVGPDAWAGITYAVKSAAPTALRVTSRVARPAGGRINANFY